MNEKKKKNENSKNVYKNIQIFIARKKSALKDRLIERAQQLQGSKRPGLNDQKSRSRNPRDTDDSEWASWSGCNAVCGTGSKVRSRICQVDVGFGGISDMSTGFQSDTLSSSFQSGIRPIRPQISMRGKRQAWNLPPRPPQTYGITAPATMDPRCDCVGRSLETEVCTASECPAEPQIDPCSWSEWSPWCGCSGNCQQGVRARTRYCYQEEDATRHRPGRRNFGSCDCPGEKVQTQDCLPTQCSSSGGGGGGGGRSSSSRPRGAVFFAERDSMMPKEKINEIAEFGIVTKKKKNNLQKNNDDFIIKDDKEKKKNFDIFEDEDEVTITAPATIDPRCDCVGRSLETEVCTASECPAEPQIDPCSWSEWSPWCGCSGNCQQGVRARTRYCYQEEDATRHRPGRRNFGSCDCPGEKVQTQDCLPTQCSSSGGGGGGRSSSSSRPRGAVFFAERDSMMSKEKINEIGEFGIVTKKKKNSLQKNNDDFIIKDDKEKKKNFDIFEDEDEVTTLINNCECRGATMQQTSCRPDRDGHNFKPPSPAVLSVSRDILNEKLSSIDKQQHDEVHSDIPEPPKTKIRPLGLGQGARGTSSSTLPDSSSGIRFLSGSEIITASDDSEDLENSKISPSNCSWSQWQSWGQCDGICGEEALINNCECRGATMQQTSCRPDRDGHNFKPPSPAVLSVSRDILNEKLSSIDKQQHDEVHSDIPEPPKTKIRPLGGRGTSSSTLPDSSSGIRFLSGSEIITASDDSEDPKDSSSNCSWSQWQSWGPCDGICGEEGERKRKRECPCNSCNSGITTEIEICKAPPCSFNLNNHKKNPFD
uniref:Uncharacterized protein n=1 Tax=Panagrolaimus sp. ES5 TaxID=591445 RepID=A0AC34F3Z7_9BILA